MTLKIRPYRAVLVLFGWYLMIPPQDPTDHAFQYHASLSTWRILNSFDTARECEKSRASYLKDVRNMMKKGEEIQFPTSCIASDDPRLREK